MTIFVHHPGYAFDWGVHVFPIEKYRLLAERLRSELGAEFLVPRPVSFEELRLVHSDDYVDRLAAIPEGDPVIDPLLEAPINARVVEGYRLHTGGTLAAMRASEDSGCGMNLGGGFHHAFADHPEGFCLINDVALAARTALVECRASRIALIDCDVHQGNGNARLFQDEPRVFTFSMHQENNYPIKESGDLDIGLEDGAGDEVYLEQLASALATIASRHDPDLVFYLAGADPYRLDQLGGLSLTLDGLRRRDRLVLEWVQQLGAPIVIVLAGGYAASTADVVGIHFTTAEESLRLWPAPSNRS